MESLTIIIILTALVVVLVVATIVLSIILRGALRFEDDFEGEISPLTGREIEVIRRKLVSVGVRGITTNEAFSLVKTLRDIQLGMYVDSDPWVPADPYEDIGRDIDEI